MTIAFMGIDLAKNVFQFHGVDAQGNTVFDEKGCLQNWPIFQPVKLGSRPAQVRSGGNVSSKLLAIQSK